MALRGVRKRVFHGVGFLLSPYRVQGLGFKLERGGMKSHLNPKPEALKPKPLIHNLPCPNTETPTVEAARGQADMPGTS